MSEGRERLKAVNVSDAIPVVANDLLVVSGVMNNSRNAHDGVKKHSFVLKPTIKRGRKDHTQLLDDSDDGTCIRW